MTSGDRLEVIKSVAKKVKRPIQGGDIEKLTIGMTCTDKRDALNALYD